MFVGKVIDAVCSGTRKRFTGFSCEDVFKDVEELGNPKTRKIKEVPAFVEVCECVKVLIDTGEPIPPQLLAKLIKFKLLWLKHIDQQRKEQEKQALEVQEASKDKGQKTVKSAGGKKGDKKTPEPVVKKETKLKKRGEEDEESKYINDEPEDGPHCYILIGGFYQAELLSYLADMGIKISAVILVKEEEQGSMCSFQENQNLSEIDNFWENLDGILQNSNDSSSLQDIAVLSCVDKSDVIQVEMDSNKAEQNTGIYLFDKIAELLYEIQTWKRQYMNYRKHTRILQVLEMPRDASHQTLNLDVYKSLLNSLAPEQESVSCILDCLVEQVVASEHEETCVAECRDTKNEIETEVREHFKMLKEKNGIRVGSCLKCFKKFNTPVITPQVLSFADDITLNNCHFHSKTEQKISCEEIEKKMLTHSTFASILQKLKDFQPCPTFAKKSAAREHEFLYFIKDDLQTYPEIDYILKIFIMESIPCECAENKGHNNACKDTLQCGWDDPYMDPFGITLCSQLSKAECFNGRYPEHRDLPSQEHESVDQSSIKRESYSSECHDATNTVALSDILSESAGDSISASDDQNHQSSDAYTVQTSEAPFSASSTYNSMQTSELLQESPAGSMSNSTYLNELQKPNHATSTASILKKTPSQAGLRNSSSVRFEDEPYRWKNLTDWCYSDQFEQQVLTQVLNEAKDEMACCDIYWQKRNSTLLLVLHNTYNSKLESSTDWSYKVHSNIGFRNYLEHVAGGISEWTAEEDSKYEAILLAEEEAKAKLAEEEKASSQSRVNSAGMCDPVTVDSSFVRAGSLKALQLEQEKLKEEAEKPRSRGKSAQKPSPAKNQSKTKSTAKEEKKQPTSRGSSKSTPSGKKPESVASSQILEEKPNDLPFYGYNLGNDLFFGSGSMQSAFPCNGSVIQVEKTQLQYGKCSIIVSVRKNGTSLYMHSNSADSKSRSLTALFKDGMRLSFTKKESSSDDKIVNTDNDLPGEGHALDTDTSAEAPEPIPKVEGQKLQVSCPDGMCIQYIPISKDCETAKVLEITNVYKILSVFPHYIFTTSEICFLVNHC